MCFFLLSNNFTFHVHVVVIFISLSFITFFLCLTWYRCCAVYNLLLLFLYTHIIDDIDLIEDVYVRYLNVFVYISDLVIAFDSSTKLHTCKWSYFFHSKSHFNAKKKILFFGRQKWWFWILYLDNDILYDSVCGIISICYCDNIFVSLYVRSYMHISYENNTRFIDFSHLKEIFKKLYYFFWAYRFLY